MNTDFQKLTITSKGFFVIDREGQFPMMQDCINSSGPCARFCGPCCIGCGDVEEEFDLIPGPDEIEEFTPCVKWCRGQYFFEEIEDQRFTPSRRYHHERIQNGKKISSGNFTSGEAISRINRTGNPRYSADRGHGTRTEGTVV